MIRPEVLLTRSLSALAIAGMLAAFAAAPAAAQGAGNLVCNGCVNSKDVKNNAIRSNDIRNGAVRSADMNANISLGRNGEDGDLGVKNAGGTESVSLDGATGNVTNRFANTAGASNGLVKAWAQIAADGTVTACWRCNPDPAETRRLDPGLYEVDFTPLGTDIRARPAMAVADDRGTIDSVPGDVSLLEHNGGAKGVAADFSSILVVTKPNVGMVVSPDLDFTVMIF